MSYTSDLAALKALMIKGFADQTAAIAKLAMPAAAPAPAPVITKLAPLDLSDRSQWNYNAKWATSEWDNGNAPIPWRDNKVVRQANGDVLFTADASGAPQLQAGEPYAYTTGFWECEVTLPKFRDGTVVAPLWLWNKDKGISEIDFEFVGRGGLEMTMHVDQNGQRQKDSKRIFTDKDLSGTRHRFGIKVTATEITMYFDGQPVHSWTNKIAPEPMKAYIEIWGGSYSNSEGWLGKFTPFAAGEKMDMIVHGYSYTPL